MKAFYRDLSDLKERTVDEAQKGCGGGYGSIEYNAIYIDENLPIEQQPLFIMHEVLHLLLKNRIKHSMIDRLGIEIIDSLNQLGFEIRKV